MSALRKGQLRCWKPVGPEMTVYPVEPILLLRSYIERGTRCPDLGYVHRAVRVWEVLSYGEVVTFTHKYLSSETEMVSGRD